MTLGLMLITSALIGWLAQAKKQRTGALWGFFTMAVLLPAWIVVYWSTSGIQPELYQTDAGWLAAAVIVCVPVGILMALIVLSLPRRHDHAPHT